MVCFYKNVTITKWVFELLTKGSVSFKPELEIIPRK